MTMANPGSSGAVKTLRPHHFGVSVPDLDSAMRWYERMLGFCPERQLCIDAIPARIAFLKRADGFRIELFEVPGAAPMAEDRRHPDQDLRTHGNKHMCFEVDSVAETLARLKEAGADIALAVNVEGNPTAFVRDCAGSLIEFLQPFEAIQAGGDR